MVDPRILTEAVEPPYASGGAANRLLAEIWDHLWPWSRNGFQRQRMVQAAGFALAVAASVAWILAAMGSMTPGAIIGLVVRLERVRGRSAPRLQALRQGRPVVGKSLPSRQPDGHAVLCRLQESADRRSPVPGPEKPGAGSGLTPGRPSRYPARRPRAARRFTCPRQPPCQFT